MNKIKIYIVKASCGKWVEEYEEWIEKIFFSEEKAKQFVADNENNLVKYDDWYKLQADNVWIEEYEIEDEFPCEKG